MRQIEEIRVFGGKTGYCPSPICIVRYIHYSSVDIRRIGTKLT